MSERGLYGSHIKLPSLDSLFSTEDERQDASLEKVQILPTKELFRFTDHPYQVRDDEEMQKMVESIKEYGVLVPLIVRPREEGGYEMIAGHRRKRACELAGITEIPAIVRDVDDDAATIFMVDSNCQRENISAIEKAKAYKMKLAAIKRQGARTDLTSGQVGQKLKAPNSVEVVADNAGESVKQVQRYIRLNELIPELQELVEENTLKFNPAVELSYLTQDEQYDFLDYIEKESCTPSLSQAQQLKSASKEQTLNEDSLKKIMTSKAPAKKPRGPGVTLAYTMLERFFTPDYTEERIIKEIIRALEAQQRLRQRGQER